MLYGASRVAERCKQGRGKDCRLVWRGYLASQQPTFFGLLQSHQCSAEHKKTQHTSSRPYAIGAQLETASREPWEPHTQPAA